MTEQGKNISIVAVIGSVRPNNMTAKALVLVADEMKKYTNISLEIIDPSKIQLITPGEESNSSVDKLQEIVSGATGIILATPEYHGSYSSTIKLVIDNLRFPSVLAGKPVALLGVASGQIGAIKALEHLRSVCSHVGSIVLPGPVSVASVHNVFDDQGHCQDAKAEKRIRALATNLVEYIQKHVCPHATLEETVREK